MEFSEDAEYSCQHSSMGGMNIHCFSKSMHLVFWKCLFFSCFPVFAKKKIK